MNFTDQIKDSFRSGNNLMKLLYINIAVFLTVKIVGVFLFLFAVPESQFSMVDWLAVPAGIDQLLTRPWTIITYMFYHEGFFHILFNMLWLFWFGQIFINYLNEKKLLTVYILGGFGGAALYILAFNAFPVFQEILPVSKALGASASVIAVVIAISVYAPNHSINLLLFGPVKLKYIALITIFIDILSITGTNSGGHIAHLGGALVGFLYIRQFQKGKNPARGFEKFMDKVFSIFKPRPKFRVTHKRPMTDYEYNKEKVKKQKEVDRVLEKIAKSGYDSLSKDEKETLFKQGGKS